MTGDIPDESEENFKGEVSPEITDEAFYG